MIEIENIWHIQSARSVLQGFSAKLQPGKIYGLMGPNGAGKTSLMKVLAGIYPLQKGQIFIQGSNYSSLDPLTRSRLLAYIPQMPQACFAYSVLDVVQMGRYPHRDKAFHTVQWALEQTELESLQYRSILELSGGELQRVFLARALAQESIFLIMDEPFTFLDLRQQINIARILRQYVLRGHTVLLSLHDVALAQKICDEVILMRSGKAFMCGSSSSILLDSHLGELYSLTGSI